LLDDWELWLRLARGGLRFHTVPVPTAEYRVHGHNQSVREGIRLDDALRHVYAQHPVPPGSSMAVARRRLLETNAAREAAYPFDVSVVVAGAGDVSGLVRTLQSAAAVLAGGRWELVLFLPDPAVYEAVLAQLSGDLQVYGVGDATPAEVWRQAADRTAGRHVLRVQEGQTLDPSAVLSALASNGPTMTDAGTGTPTAAASAVPGPRLRQRDGVPL
ncbi:MAG: hypothetical protein QOC98_1528, partial [Frankiaceae bacterium]|nr:hypothetical protein [Frankiaceae bacterium]